MKHVIKSTGVAVAASAPLLTGCAGSPSPDSSASAEPLADSISIVVAQYSTGTQAHWQQVIADFNKAYPDVKVDLQVLDWGALTPTVNTLIQTEQYPDILNFGNWASFADAGLLYPASDVLSTDQIADFLPTFADNSKLDGVQYALPYVASINVMYYNEDIFAKAGVTAPPTTFDDMLKVCQQIKAYDPTIAPYALALGAVGGTAEATLWAYAGGGSWYDDAKGSWAINSATNIATFTYLNELKAKGCTEANPGQTNTGDGTFPLFQHGKAAMAYATLGNSPAFMKPIQDAGMHVKATTIPTNNGTKPFTLGIQDNLEAFKKPGNKVLVQEILKRFYEPQHYAAVAKTEGLFPTTKSALDITLKDPDTGLSTDDLSLLEQSRFYPTTKPGWSAANARIKSDIGLTVTDGNDVAQVLGAIQDAAAAG